MRPNTLVYISGAISPKNGKLVEQNVADASYFFLECIKHGIPAYLPHLTALLPSAHSDVSYEKWMDYDLAVINFCTHMVMLPGWAKSKGAVQEETYAASKGIPIFYTFEEMLKELVADVAPTA